MKNRSRRMKQAITYWPPGVNDGFGGVTYGAPVTIMGRWEDKAELFRDAQAREVVSSAVVFLAEPVELGGYLFLGESVEATPVDGAKEIRQAGSNLNLRQLQRLNRAWL